jgi:hypothetical protein
LQPREFFRRNDRRGFATEPFQSFAKTVVGLRFVRAGIRVIFRGIRR